MKTLIIYKGRGTRLYGSLPEYIYSTLQDGLYINLFAGSSITWKQDGQDMKVHMKTNFPYNPKVELKVSILRPAKEVYDVKHDPHETANLAADPKYKTKLNELRQRYKQLKKIHGVPEDVWNKAKTKF